MRCLQIGLYLASWGMMRGSSPILQLSVRAFTPLLHTIAATPSRIWDIDLDTYTPETIQLLLGIKEAILTSLQESTNPSPWIPSDMLVSKIMLGIFGNTLACDTYFTTAFGIRHFDTKGRGQIAQVYQTHKTHMDTIALRTLDCDTGCQTHRAYPKAKILDMVGFIEGFKHYTTIKLACGLTTPCS